MLRRRAILPVVEGKSRLQGNLIVLNAAVLDLAAHLYNFEPTKVPQCRRGSGYRNLDRIRVARR
jgi:hypothetical protein